MAEKNRIRFPLRLRMALIVTAMSLILCIVSIVLSNSRFSATNEELFKNQSMDVAKMAVLTIDTEALRAVTDRTLEIYRSIPDDEIMLSDLWETEGYSDYVDRYSSVMEMPEFKKVHEQLSSTQTLGISTLSSIYTTVYTFDRETEHAIYIVDAAEEDPCLPGVIDHVDEFDWESARQNKSIDPYVTNVGAYGWLVTATAPIFDKNGDLVAYMGVDLDMTEIKANENNFLIILSSILVGLTAVSTLITLLIIGSTVVDPIKKLSDAAEGYVGNEEGRKLFSSIDIKSADEIGGLSDAMKKMESDIQDYVKNITAITAEKERVGAELSIAAKLQADMLPKKFPERSDISLFATMTPAKEMGGDFYDFIMIDDDHIGLVMADVSGKGVPAAMFMLVARTLLKIRTAANGKPSQILSEVNNMLCEDNPSGLFVTAWLGILTLSSGELICSNAGHEYPAVMHENGEYGLAENDNMPPLAAMEDMEYYDETMTLGKGDRLFLYTDGVPEAKSPAGARFGIKRMLEILNREKDDTPEELLAEMKKETDSFTGNNDPFDDITMMSVVWNGK